MKNIQTRLSSLKKKRTSLNTFAYNDHNNNNNNMNASTSSADDSDTSTGSLSQSTSSEKAMTKSYAVDIDATAAASTTLGGGSILKTKNSYSSAEGERIANNESPLAPSAVAAMAGMSSLGAVNSSIANSSNTNNNSSSRSDKEMEELKMKRALERQKFEEQQDDDDHDHSGNGSNNKGQSSAREYSESTSMQIVSGEMKEECKEEEDKFLVFENWLRSCGAEFPDMYLKRYSKDCRGVHAKRKVEMFTPIVSIPLRCLITDKMGRTQTDAGRLLFSSPCSLSSANLIAVVLYVLETRRDPGNMFRYYYDILPKDYSCFPIFWDDDMLEWLRGSSLVGEIADRKAAMLSDYNEICKYVPWFRHNHSFQEFLEIRTAVGSRNFGIVVDNEKQTALVPYADMLNHFRPRETSWTYENSTGCFTITSLTGLEPGQQVMDSYGKKCCSKFFLHYGFAVEVNREEDGKCQNEIATRLSIAQHQDQDPLCGLKLSYLGANKGTKTFRISMNYEDKATTEAFSYLRVLVANENELDIIMSRSSSQLSSTLVQFISSRNEAAALLYLANHYKKYLTGYPKTLEENDELLRTSTLAKPFSNFRTALIVIRSEQEVAHFWIHVSQVIGQILRTCQTSSSLTTAFRNLPKDTFFEKDTLNYVKCVFGGILPL